MIADIVTGHTALGDIFFLVAVVLALVAAVVAWRPSPDARLVALGWLALAFVAAGLLVQ